MTLRPPTRPHGTALFGHTDALSFAHTQLHGWALRRGARQASAVNALGEALPLALAAVVQPQLRTHFRRIDRITGRTPRAPLQPLAPPRSTPPWRLPDYALSQGASSLGLGLKLSLLVGACVYHIAASVVVGLFFGLAEGRLRLDAEGICAAMRWRQLRAPKSFGALISRTLLTACLGPAPTPAPAPPVPARDVALRAAQPLWPQGPSFVSMRRAWASAAPGETPSLRTCAIAMLRQPSRQALQMDVELRLGAVVRHIVRGLAADPHPKAPANGLSELRASIDWAAVARALDAGLDAEAGQLLGPLALTKLSEAVWRPAHVKTLQHTLMGLKLSALRAHLRRHGLDFCVPLVTEAQRTAVAAAIGSIDWAGCAASGRALHLSDVARAVGTRCEHARGQAVLQSFAAVRDVHLGRPCTL